MCQNEDKDIQEKKQNNKAHEQSTANKNSYDS
jgi:hypothetical protein